MDKHLLFRAWVRLMRAFFIAFLVSLISGLLLINLLDVSPEKIFAISTKRISIASSLIDKGFSLGIDKGILIFAWNSISAIAIISFAYTASLLNPRQVSMFPRLIRSLLCGETRMKVLCYLPGCLRFEEEALRRLYVWLMIPLIGIVLLGLECGFIVSTASYLTGSYFVGIVALLPHGIIEIPAITLAGAVVFSAHMLMKEDVGIEVTGAVFEKMVIHRGLLPVRRIAISVVLCLLIAGLIEAHITQRLVEGMLS